MIAMVFVRLIFFIISILQHISSAELTQEDLAGIRDIVFEIVSKEINPLKDDFKKLSGDVEILSGDVGSLKDDFKKLSGDVGSLKTITQEGFRGIHNIGRDRVSIAKQVTNLLLLSLVGCSGSFTRHAFIFNDYVGELFTPHADCTNATQDQLRMRDDLFLLHPTKDVGIIAQCPSKDAVLDISISTIPQLGDNVIAFGFGDTASVWTGPISKLVENKDDPFNGHWAGTSVTNITSGEYLVQSAQHLGMSGAATSNGCGYLGMAHAVDVADLGLGYFSAIISAKDIQTFILDMIVMNPHKLKRYKDCFQTNHQPLDIVSFPIFPFMNCSTDDSFPTSVTISALNG
jgi:hypothetical protein